jgi:hypothetical protein
LRCTRCDIETNGNFCSNCGQSLRKERFDYHFLLKKLVSAFDIHSGFFFTLKALVVHPGSAIKKYLEGKVSGFFNPLKMFLMIGALANFLTLYFEVFTQGEVLWFGKNLEDYHGYTLYSTRYFSFFSLTAIPLFSLFSWLFFKESKFNFTENLILNFYIAIGQFLIICVMVFPMDSFQGDPVQIAYGVLNIGYNLWVLMVFFKAYHLMGIIKVIFAVGIPQVCAFFMNYYLYRISPTEMWAMLDRIFV